MPELPEQPAPAAEPAAEPVAENPAAEPVAENAAAEPAAEPVSTEVVEERAEYADVFFLALVALALGKALLSRYLGLPGSSISAGLIFESAAIVAILGITDLIPRRRSHLLDLGVYLALSVVMLVNVVYIQFFDSILNPAMLSVAGQTGDVASSVTSLFRPVYLLYVLDIPFLAVWAFAMMRRHDRPQRRSVAVAACTAVAVVLFAVQVVVVMRISPDVDARAIAKARGFGAYQVASFVRLALPESGSGTAAAASITDKNLTPGQAVQRQIDELRKASDGSRVATFSPGAFKGKNVIIVQVEALQDLVVGQKIDGQEITPNLNKLVAQSWYFPNTFSEAGAGNTVDAEFVTNTSLMPPLGKAASIEYVAYELPGLPRLMRQQGYDAITLHQNTVKFWNREQLYPVLGFRRWWDYSYFGLKDKMWRASDEVLFSDGMKVLRSEDASTAPFYAFFITMSSHNPFDLVPFDRRPVRLSAADEKTWSGRYVGAISYTDKAIGEFIQQLKDAGMWDDTIFIVYGDHSALLDTGPKPGDRDIPGELLQRPFTLADKQRIPLIIHVPGQTTPEVQTRPAGQIDIMPTVADLVGIDMTATPHLGRSLFVNSNALIPDQGYLPAGTFVDNSTVFLPGLGFDDGTALSVADGSTVQKTQQLRSEYDISCRLTALSDQWIRSLPHSANAGAAKGAAVSGVSKGDGGQKK